MKSRGIKPPTLPNQKNSRYKKFQKRYWHDPVGFVLNCISWKKGQAPTSYQREILHHLVHDRRACVRGPHGLGKTALLSWVILWFALTRDGQDWKLPTTASAWRQLEKYLWPEVHKWARRLRWDVIGRAPFDDRNELHGLSLRLSTGEAFAVASNNHELIEGAHADHLLYVFDEAKAIPDATFDAAEGAFSTAGIGGTEGFAIAASTPGEPAGRFYEIQKRNPGYLDWWVRAVSLKETMQANRVQSEWVDARRKQWGANSALFKRRVLGNFAADGADSVIPLAWIEAANERWLANVDHVAATYKLTGDEDTRQQKALRLIESGRLPGYTFRQVGVDVADGGGDESGIAPLFGMMVTRVQASAEWDTMQLAGMVKDYLASLAGATPDGKPLAIIDVLGLGAGTYRRLKEQGMNVFAFNASSKAYGRDASEELRFVNKRSHAIWNVRDLLNPDNNPELALPPDPQLIGDLAAIRAGKYMSNGRIAIEPKETIKGRIGRSPDRGDMVTYACYPIPPEMMQRLHGESQTAHATEVPATGAPRWGALPKTRQQSQTR